MLSYIPTMRSFCVGEKQKPELERPYVSPFWEIWCLDHYFYWQVLYIFQLQDQSYRYSGFVFHGLNLIIGLMILWT